MRGLVWLFITLGSIVGGIIPSIFGAGAFSLWGLVGSTLGAIAGIFVYRYLDL